MSQERASEPIKEPSIQERIEWLRTQAHLDRLQLRADCETAWTTHQQQANASMLWRFGRWFLQQKLGQSGGFLGALFNLGLGSTRPSSSGFGKHAGTISGFAAAMGALLWKHRSTLRQVKRSAGMLAWCAKKCLKRKRVWLPVALVVLGVGLIAWFRNKKDG